MTRTLRLVIWFLIGFAISAIPMLALAETVAATTATATCINSASGPPNYATYGLTLIQACQRASNGENTGSHMSTTYGWMCIMAPNSSLTTTCSTGTYAQKYCPGGWTLSGTNCTRADCPEGQTRDQNDVCQPPCPINEERVNGVCQCEQDSPNRNPLTGKCWVCDQGDNRNQGMVFTGAGSIPSTLCVGDCKYNYQGVGVGTSTGWVLEGGLGTGEYCNSSAVVPDEESKPPEDEINKDSDAAKCVKGGQAYGTVNGVVVCVPATSTKKSETKTVVNKDSQNNTISTTTTTTTTNSTTSGGSRTTNTTVTNPDGTKTETTVTGPAGGNGAGDGEGDDPGTPPEAGPLNEQANTVQSIGVVTIATDMTCPSGITLPNGWGEISYQPACDLAALIRPLTILFAWLAAGFFVVGAVRV